MRYMLAVLRTNTDVSIVAELREEEGQSATQAGQYRPTINRNNSTVTQQILTHITWILTRNSLFKDNTGIKPMDKAMDMDQVGLNKGPITMPRKPRA